MKRVFFILALGFAAATTAQAQDVYKDGDTLTVKKADGERMITITREREDFSLSVGGFDIKLNADGTYTGGSTDFVSRGNRVISKGNRHISTGLRFGFIGLSGDQEFMELRNQRSISVATDFLANFPLDGRDKVWFISGLGMRWDNYVFSESITVGKVDGVIRPIPIDRNFKKSKLSTFTLEVPVRVRVAVSGHMSLSAGLYGGVVLGDRTKMKYPKIKDKGDFAITPFQAGATVRLRAYWVGVFANYNFTPLFKHGKGPRVHPFTIGIFL
jgi:hypothetical protein